MIDFDYIKKTISYRLTQKDIIEPYTVNIQAIEYIVQVWPIFWTKGESCGDGYPLVCAYNNENGWTFRNDGDKILIDHQLDVITREYASIYPDNVMIIIHGCNKLSNAIADKVSRRCKDTNLIDNVICGLTTEEVDEIVLDFNSKFREVYKDDFNEKYRQLTVFLDKMDKERQGKFSRHLIEDTEMRDAIDLTLKHSESRYAESANKVNGQNILIIDDTIGRGQQVNDICNILFDSYAPESITVMRLLPEKSEDKIEEKDSLYIKEGATKIDTFFMNDCPELTSFVVPEGITEIEHSFLNNCVNLKSVIFPNSLKRIDEYCLQGCVSLESVVIPDGVASIGCQFLEGCTNLKSVSLPKSLTKLESFWTFHRCPNLKTITVDEANPVYDSRENCNAVIETATDCLMLGCANSKIPDSVREIGPSAFELCEINSLVIPEGVKKIGCAAFCGCFTLETSIPDSVEVIESYAFNACHKLKEIIVPPSVKRIEDHAFYQCRNLSVVTFTSSKIELCSAVFDDCKKLKKIIVPKRSKRKFVRMLGEKFADKIIIK